MSQSSPKSAQTVYDCFPSPNKKQSKCQKVCLELWLLSVTVTLSRQQLHFPRVMGLKELICFLTQPATKTILKLMRSYAGFSEITNSRDTNPGGELRIDVGETCASGNPIPLPSFFFFFNKKGYLTEFFLYLSKYNLTVQSPGPSSRDILGETHLLNIGKLANVISDMTFLRNRHKVP